MESWFWFCWISLLTLFRNVSSDPTSPPRYTLHHTRVSFDRALQHCSPGVLASLSTQQELSDVLRLVTEAAPTLHQNQFTFWVGLRKVKNECVVPTLPLRGFKWTEDGREDSQVSRWAEEPQETCTTVRCAAVKGELNGSTVASWGLIPVSCRNTYQFICKLRNRETSMRPEPESEQVTPEPESDTPEPDTPEPEQTPPVPTPAKPELPKPEPKLPTRGPKPETFLTPETELQKSDLNPGSDPAPTPAHGPDLAARPAPAPGSDPAPDPAPGSAPAPGSDLCKRPGINGSRSYRLDHTNSSRIVVECWSSAPVELVCSGRPAVWRLLDDSPANFTTVCVPCEDGFQKDASGTCVDVDECGGKPCRHMCLNTVGSFSCFCSDENGKHHDEDSPECADMSNRILIPVLVAVAALVVLVVVIAVTVKCCLMRRSKKRAMKKAEKMAMESKEGKDSFETANEKVAT